MKGKRVLAVLLGAVLALMAGMTAWALPAGLSVIDGRTVRSSQAGFEVSFPEGYQVARTVSGTDLDYLTYMQEEGVKVDFMATAANEEQESFILNAGIVLDGQQEDVGLKEIKQMLQEDAAYAPYVSMGTTVIAGAAYESMKINYGALLAGYMGALMEDYEMTPEEKQEYDSYMAELAGSMFFDIYIRDMGGSSYVLVQIYSGGQAGNAAYILGQMRPYAGGGWRYTEDGGWQYMKSDGTYAVDEWALDEDGLTYRLDGSGRIMYGAWIGEGGRWRYVDEFGHMATNITKTIDDVQYTFDAQGYMAEGSERSAAAYGIGSVSGHTYSNRWSNLLMEFPEAAELILGDGSAFSYPLEAGENMYYWLDEGSGYLLTIDYTDADQQLDRYLEWLMEYAGYFGYKVDSTGTVNMGGYEYKAVKSSRVNSDGSSDHEDTYFRQIDGKLMEISIEYTGGRQADVDRILAAVRQVQQHS